MLRPGGLVAIYEHNPLNPVTMRVVNTCPFDEHAVLLRKRETRDLVAAEGFTAIEARTMMTVPPSSAPKLIPTMVSRLNELGRSAWRNRM